MKKETLEKRISENLSCKNGAVKRQYVEVIDIVRNPKHGRRYLTSWENHGRSLRDRRPNAIEGLRLIGIDFATGNDAPRHGMDGQYIELTPKGRRQVKEYADYHRMSNN